MTMNQNLYEGVLLVDKPRGVRSFDLVRALRKITGIKKIGHGGTLDPFATGVMVLLIGRQYTKLADKLLTSDKEYVAELKLGEESDTFDCDGTIVYKSSLVPTLEQIEEALTHFQGEIDQIPPMFSAKKVKGKRLYELARKGEVIERAPVKVTVQTRLISYNYPHLNLEVKCSKGTYIRSIAHDLGQMLGIGAYLTELQRTKCGDFRVENCMNGKNLFKDEGWKDKAWEDEYFLNYLQKDLSPPERVICELFVPTC